MGLTEEFEQKYWCQGMSVLGLDEAGRGPMAGPCVVAGVVFPIGYDNTLIDDSKKMSEKKRAALFETIKEESLYFAIEIIDAQTIDRLNIYQATRLAMEKIATEIKVDMVLTDAMPLTIDCKYESIIKGDARSLSIAAASILAKVTRDEMMVAYALEYPEYGFDKHKGYGTKKHKEAILKYGRTPIHRQTFKFKDEDQISLDI